MSSWTHDKDKHKKEILLLNNLVSKNSLLMTSFYHITKEKNYQKILQKVWPKN